MTEDAAKVRKLLRQQAAIATFGSYALRESDLLKVLTEAARVCAEGLEVPFSKVCRYRAAENDLLIEAGYGWQPGVVGHVVSRADVSSPQGRAFATGEPSICNELRSDNNFVLPPFYAAHGIVSTIDVIIKGGDRPYGVLEIDSDKQHDYDQHDIDFLTGLFETTCNLSTVCSVNSWTTPWTMPGNGASRQLRAGFPRWHRCTTTCSATR
jgi:GAF domain-containing protein